MVSPLCPECDGTSVALDTVLVIPPYPPDDGADTVEASRVACALPTNGSIASMASSCRSDANSSTVGPTCRICDYSGEAANQLINPCRCSGTSKFVHEQCLNVRKVLTLSFKWWFISSYQPGGFQKTVADVTFSPLNFVCLSAFMGKVDRSVSDINVISKPRHQFLRMQIEMSASLN